MTFISAIKAIRAAATEKDALAILEAITADAALTAANERIRELDMAFCSAEDRIIELRDQLTVEREVSDKLEKVLNGVLKLLQIKQYGVATDCCRGALAEVAAIRARTTAPTAKESA